MLGIARVVRHSREAEHLDSGRIGHQSEFAHIDPALTALILGDEQLRTRELAET